MKTKSSTETVGIDLGDRKHAICVLDAAGEILTDSKITNSRDAMTRLSKKHPGALVVMEVETPVARRPLADPGVRNYRTGLPEWTRGGTADRRCLLSANPNAASFRVSSISASSTGRSSSTIRGIDVKRA
jgi:hypothetical protein